MGLCQAFLANPHQLRANEEELNRIFARIFDTTEEVLESYKGNRCVRTSRDEVVSLIRRPDGCGRGAP